MLDALDRFEAALRPGDTALFYYSDHGAQAGANFLVPIDAGTPKSARRLRNETLALDEVLSVLRNRRMFGAVFQRVKQTPGGEQVPWKNDNLTDERFLLQTANADGDLPPAPIALVGHLQVNVGAPVEVLLDGRPVGSAAPGRPLSLRDLAPGEHAVEVRGDGSAAGQRARVRAGQWT